MPKQSPKALVYLFVLLIPFLLLFFKPDILRRNEMRISELLSGPMRLITWPVREVKILLTYRGTFSDYQKQKRENDILKARLVGLEEVIRENSRFERLLAFRRDLVFSSTAALVIGRDPNNWNATVTINKGSADGIKPGMPVVNAIGVVGKISEVADHTSRVVMVNDPSFSVAAIVQGSRESGLLTGSLTGKCRMLYLPYDAEIHKGDLVVTSKISSSFPEGLLIGKIIQAKQSQSSPSLESFVQPAVDITTVEEVLVILNE